MNVPIEIFLPFIGLAFGMSIIGFLTKQKTPFLLLIAGSMISFWGIITDVIILGSIPLSSTVSGATTTYVMQDRTFDFTEYPKIFFSLIGAILFIVGAIEWHNHKDNTIQI